MRLLLIIANVLLPIAALIFASGFFPYKPFIPGLASHADLAHHGDPPKPQFDRVIFMVVDALRSDFVFSSASGFSYTQRYVHLLLLAEED
jgi:ethanolaminephosphotransferase